MSPFGRKKKKDKDKPADSKESTPSTSLEAASMFVRFMELTGLMDVTPISEEVRKGNMVVMDVSPLIQQGTESQLQLRRAVEQLRAVCISVDGDIGQLGNRYIILTPTRVKIFRESPSDDMDIDMSPTTTE
ncbi:MAG: cell division protein SepF [Candidatus Thorarchaeota archaeon]